MSTKQSQAIWELCRQGFQRTADEAARCWHSGQRFQAHDVHVAHSLKDLIDQCNWEIEKMPSNLLISRDF
ncbi:hypothetical protein [Chromatium okenii]|jgi:hypothetical protein|uniref:Uncharacterized protein n=1 Tax=Chromatium okenii TaxID=61644 RepID=A0A2S7XNQ8_9GAMM|nr:hypothetical protein [Chromatium okenii]MBV5310317.1 hypothetical protein [Chromatium okenii]PQJ95068.1 hypothetical protein CXB77_12135 [Chromatium okenii]